MLPSAAGITRFCSSPPVVWPRRWSLGGEQRWEPPCLHPPAGTIAGGNGCFVIRPPSQCSLIRVNTQQEARKQQEPPRGVVNAPLQVPSLPATSKMKQISLKTLFHVLAWGSGRGAEGQPRLRGAPRRSGQLRPPRVRPPGPLRSQDLCDAQGKSRGLKRETFKNGVVGCHQQPRTSDFD